MSSNNNDIDNVSVANEKGFSKAMCTCISMGVLNAKLIISSNDKKMWVRGLLSWQQDLHSKESHHALLLSKETHVPNVESVRVSPCCHGNEVSVVTSHTWTSIGQKNL